MAFVSVMSGLVAMIAVGLAVSPAVSWENEDFRPLVGMSDKVAERVTRFSAVGLSLGVSPWVLPGDIDSIEIGLADGGYDYPCRT